MNCHLKLMVGLIALVLFSGCVTPLPKSLSRLEVGMDKSQVLEIAGNPKRTRRQSGRDQWDYVYYIQDEELKREVHFEQGKVVHIGPAVSVTKEVLSPEKARNMKELEERSQHLPSSHSPKDNSDDSGFQDL